MFDIELLGDELARLVRDHAAQSTAPLAEQIKALDLKIGALPAPKDGKDGASGSDGKDGAPGLNGKDADPETIRQQVAQAIAAIPAPQDGQSVDLVALAGDIAAAAAKAVSALPPGLNGKDGTNGLSGKDGAHGKDADPALVAAMVAKAVAELPQPDDLQAFAAALARKFTAAEHAH